MIIKVNYTVSNPIIKITYDETPIYVSTTSNPIYVSVNYGGTSSGGTVTSVGLTMPNGFSVSGSPITTTGTLLVTGAGTTAQYLRGDGTLATFPTITSGTVTSVGLTMPSAFTVTSSPITTSGSIAVTGSGTTSQYVRGDGTLATFPTLTSAEDLIKEVYNESGATMAKGTVVYINGSHGNLPTIAKALATGDATSAQTLGMVQTDITNMNNGYIVIIGSLIDMDTQAFVNGTQLYLSGVTAGAYTSTKQYAPIHLVYVGIVVRSHPTQGIISVKVQNGFEVDEIHNLSAQNPSNNDGIFYNTSNSLWENKSIATVLGYTPVNPARTISTTSPLSGGGDLSANRTLTIAQATTSTDGYLSSTDWNTFNNKFNLPSLTNGSVLFSNGTTIAQDNANLFWDDTNNRLGIGTATPSAILHTVGSVTASSAIARGNYMQPTLVAAANSDVLVGLDIAPTFTVGAFTGVTSTALRVTGNLDTNSIRTSSTLNIYNTSGGNDVNIGSTNGSTFFFNIRNTGATLSFGVFQLTSNLTGSANGSNRYNTSGTYSGTQTAGLLVGFQFNPTISSFTLTSPASLTGFRFVPSSVTGTGSVYGFEGNLNSGTDRWNLYMSGTANNYLAGNLLIGTTTDAGYRLDVNGTARVSGKLSVGTPSAASAVMEVTSTTQGFLPPRMTTTQKTAIATPAAGLMVFDTTLVKLCVYSGTAWQTITSL